MSSSLEVLVPGTTRRTKDTLLPGVYPWNDQLGSWKAADAFVRLARSHHIMRVERLEGDGRWGLLYYELDTLQVIPTWWERVLAFVTFRRQPIPKAIVININTPSK